MGIQFTIAAQSIIGDANTLKKNETKGVVGMRFTIGANNKDGGGNKTNSGSFTFGAAGIVK